MDTYIFIHTHEYGTSVQAFQCDKDFSGQYSGIPMMDEGLSSDEFQQEMEASMKDVVGLATEIGHDVEFEKGEDVDIIKIDLTKIPKVTWNKNQ